MLNKWLITSVLGFILSGSALADSLFTCQDTPGDWSGKGTFQIKFVKCQYEGDGNISSLSGDDLLIDVGFQRMAGGPVCPDTFNVKFKATCINNHIEVHDFINDGEINLRGELGDHSAHIEGSVSKPKGNLSVDIKKK